MNSNPRMFSNDPYHNILPQQGGVKRTPNGFAVQGPAHDVTMIFSCRAPPAPRRLGGSDVLPGSDRTQGKNQI